MGVGFHCLRNDVLSPMFRLVENIAATTGKMSFLGR
jgi:hypothetical protein